MSSSSVNCVNPGANKICDGIEQITGSNEGINTSCGKLVVTPTSGNTHPILAVDNYNPVPIMVSMRQARLALLQAGLLHIIDAAIATMPEAAQIEWEYATDIKRDYPLLLQVQSAIGMTDQQLDDLFIAAASIV